MKYTMCVPHVCANDKKVLKKEQKRFEVFGEGAGDLGHGGQGGTRGGRGIYKTVYWWISDHIL